MDTDILLNDFAIRSFRDMADGDYVVARMAYRAHLPAQFMWSALQAVEKYLKCILVLNRVKTTGLGHDLKRALARAETQLPFKLELSERSREIIRHLDTYGRFRYFESSYHVRDLEMTKLDLAVWELRRYCANLNYSLTLPDGKKKSMLNLELKAIEESGKHHRVRYTRIGGVLEKIVRGKKSVQRDALVWQNPCFGRLARQTIRPLNYLQSANSPLSLHPEILDEVLKYVYLPKEAIDAYRMHARSKVQESSRKKSGG